MRSHCCLVHLQQCWIYPDEDFCAHDYGRSLRRVDGPQRHYHVFCPEIRARRRLRSVEPMNLGKCAWLVFCALPICASARDLYKIHRLSERELMQTYTSLMVDGCRHADKFWKAS